MAFDLQEQEQIDDLKVVWQQWGRWVAALIACLALAYLGYTGWQLYQAKQVEASAVLYNNLESAAQDQKAFKAAVSQIETGYPSSPYAGRAALLAAKSAIEHKNLAEARVQLNWAISHAKEPLIVTLAQLRLSQVLLDEKQYDAALTQLERPHDPAFDALYFDAKGDVFSLKGDKGGAADAYRSALAKLSGDAPGRDFIQIKLDALGG